jgi:hypothetical protein
VTQFSTTLAEAGKAFVTAWAVVALDPWLGEQLPRVPELLRWGLSALVCAVLLEIVLVVAVGRPRLFIHWSVYGDPADIHQIVAKVSANHPESELFNFKLALSRRTWLGGWVLRGLLKGRTQLRVLLTQAELIPTVEGSSYEGEVPAVIADRRTKGVSTRLINPPKRPGEWRWAEVRWEATSFPESSTTNIDYELFHPSRRMRLLLKLCIGVSSNVDTVRVIRI